MKQTLRIKILLFKISHLLPIFSIRIKSLILKYNLNILIKNFNKITDNKFIMKKLIYQNKFNINKQVLITIQTDIE